ncbi:regulatory protein, luxR family [Geodermatophilus ruber]|uniref:Regulatory protein, luxR family n=2 Tax=Geodermatophilus ruber TaxID=504800 RepID=A0A1I4DXC0_9ACTN|nr:regulatory protein, luxR family [Geodermatophilus ruber]
MADICALVLVAETVAAVLCGEADVSDVLASLKGIVQFDTAMLSSFDPAGALHQPLAQVGYDDVVAAYAASGLRARPTSAQVLQPEGFRGIVTVPLFLEPGAKYTGQLVLRPRDEDGLTDEEHEVLVRLASLLARVADVRGPRPWVDEFLTRPTLDTAVVRGGQIERLRGDAAFRLCQSHPDLLRSAGRLIADGRIAASGYVSEADQWWRITLIRMAADLTGEATGVLVTAERQSSLPHGLTSRELDVLSLVARGASNSEIAEELAVSVRTITTHVERLFLKLGRPSRAGCAGLAEAQGLVRLGRPGGDSVPSGRS